MADDEALHVLLAAYACHPDAGSEPGVGWQWLRAVATRHEVTLLTGKAEDGRLDEEIRRLGLPVTVVQVTTPADVIHLDSPLRYLRYGMWLAAAARRATQLERTIGPDVGHHVTYASDWLPTPLAALRRTPFVWGPVGGATYSAPGVTEGLSARARVFERVRKLVGSVSRKTLARSTVRQAGLIVALNRQTADVYAGRPLVSEPNAAFDYDDFPDPVEVPTDRGADRRAVYAGRLLEWKGLHIAVRAMADARAADWTLDIYGAGPERTPLEVLARDLGLAGRIRFRGRVSRAECLHEVARADAFVFPSLHDSAPWAVAEAAALGVPVLCFDAGAAPTLAGPCTRLLDPADPVGSLATRLHEVGVTQPARTPYREFSVDRLPEVVQEWYALVRS